MENQHRKIKGYRELNETEIALMNRIKEHAAATADLIADVDQYLMAQSRTAATSTEEERIYRSEPGRWLATGKTDLQKGFMSLTRSVAQPEFF